MNEANVFDGVSLKHNILPEKNRTEGEACTDDMNVCEVDGGFSVSSASSVGIAMDGRTQRPQFFKVLLPGFKLRFPRAFVEHIADDNHGRAAIFSRAKFWPVKVEEDREGLYFGDGWQEIADFHDLRVGYFVFFRYEGNMVFSLKVFDTSQCRKYEFPISRKSSKKRKARLDVDDEIPEVVLKKESEMKMELFGSKKQLKLVGNNKRIHFERVIRPCHMLYPIINVPRAFCKLSGLLENKKVMIRDPEGRFWPVKLCVGRSPKFSKGWGNLLKENKIEEGDVCAFELVCREKIIVEVQIKRAQLLLK